MSNGNRFVVSIEGNASRLSHMSIMFSTLNKSIKSHPRSKMAPSIAIPRAQGLWITLNSSYFTVFVHILYMR